MAPNKDTTMHSHHVSTRAHAQSCVFISETQSQPPGPGPAAQQNLNQMLLQKPASSAATMSLSSASSSTSSSTSCSVSPQPTFATASPNDCSHLKFFKSPSPAWFFTPCSATGVGTEFATASLNQTCLSRHSSNDTGIAPASGVVPLSGNLYGSSSNILSSINPGPGAGAAGSVPDSLSDSRAAAPVAPQHVSPVTPGSPIASMVQASEAPPVPSGMNHMACVAGVDCDTQPGSGSKDIDFGSSASNITTNALAEYFHGIHGPEFLSSIPINSEEMPVRSMTASTRISCTEPTTKRRCTDTNPEYADTRPMGHLHSPYARLLGSHFSTNVLPPPPMHVHWQPQQFHVDPDGTLSHPAVLFCSEPIEECKAAAAATAVAGPQSAVRTKKEISLQKMIMQPARTKVCAKKCAKRPKSTKGKKRTNATSSSLQSGSSPVKNESCRSSTTTTTVKKRRRRTTRVAHACAHCKYSKTKCDNQRPCARCIRLDRASSCCDSVHRKRGRKRKAIVSTKTATTTSTSTTTTTVITTVKEKPIPFLTK
jgi:hypothetical protein